MADEHIGTHYAVTAEFRTKADCIAAIGALMGRHAVFSRGEPGCLAFDVCQTPGDETACHAHQATPHYGGLGEAAPDLAGPGEIGCSWRGGCWPAGCKNDPPRRGRNAGNPYTPNDRGSLMNRFKLLGFNHTSFTVTHLDRPIGFFRDLLGFELQSRGPRDDTVIQRLTQIPGASIMVAFLIGPGHTVELIEYTGPAERGVFLPPTCDAGSSHLAFNVDDLDAAVEGARPYGFELMGEVVSIDAGPNKGRRIVYLRSPDGLTVEFLEFREAV